MTMRNSYNSIDLPSAEYDQLQNLMLTMIGSRTALASMLRRKLGSAGRATSRVSPDVVMSGRRVQFRIDGQQSEARVLSWKPQKRGDPGQLSLLSPRGLALLGLSPGQSISYSTQEGRMEFLEVERSQRLTLLPRRAGPRQRSPVEHREFRPLGRRREKSQEQSMSDVRRTWDDFRQGAPFRYWSAWVATRASR